jgi:predicted DNA-binding protein (UPF0251 family)
MEPAPSDSWRSWLVTGTPAMPVDRRRVRGAHRGLKKMLIEGMSNGGVRPWKDFSGAMIRQAVNEALSQLPPEHSQVVKLAYFGGLSNREIADRLGISVAAVQRKLRQALARISDHVEHGRAFGRRALYAFLAWLAGRQIFGTEHAGGALAVAAVAVTLAVQPAAVPAPAGAAAPAAVSQPAHVEQRTAPPPAATSAPAPPDAGRRAAAAVKSVGVPALPVSVAAPPVSVPALPVSAPQVPPPKLP